MICDKCKGNGFTIVKGKTIHCKKCLSSGELPGTPTPPKYLEDDLAHVYQTLYEKVLKLSGPITDPRNVLRSASHPATADIAACSSPAGRCRESF